jgi:hypothetical protein
VLRIRLNRASAIQSGGKPPHSISSGICKEMLDAVH